MNLFKYPDTETGHDLLRKYNKLFDSGTLGTSGTVGLALDVWRDGHHLFASYGPEQGESMEVWAMRNYPLVANPDYATLPMGLKHGVAAVDRFQVPTRAATKRSLTYSHVEWILKAALATAQLPHGPEALSIVPTANTLRQRMHTSPTDGWLALQIHDLSNRITIRAVVCKQPDTGSEPGAAYEAVLVPRERSKLDGGLAPDRTDFHAPDADLSDPVARRPVIKAAKAALGIVGQHLAVRSTEGQDIVEYAMTAEPFALWIRAVTRPEPIVDTSPRGFDL